MKSLLLGTISMFTLATGASAACMPVPGGSCVHVSPYSAQKAPGVSSGTVAGAYVMGTILGNALTSSHQTPQQLLANELNERAGVFVKDAQAHWRCNGLARVNADHNEALKLRKQAVQLWPANRTIRA